MTASEALSAALGSVLSDGAAKARALAAESIKDAIALGGDAGERAAAAARGLGTALSDVAAGRLTIEAGRVVSQRYIDALNEVRAGAIEAAQVKAAARAAEGLAIAKDLGFAVLKAAAMAAAAAL